MSKKKRLLQIDSLLKRNKGNFTKTIFRIDAVIVDLIKSHFLEKDKMLKNFTKPDNESEFLTLNLEIRTDSRLC